MHLSNYLSIYRLSLYADDTLLYLAQRFNNQRNCKIFFFYFFLTSVDDIKISIWFKPPFRYYKTLPEGPNKNAIYI